MGELVRAAERLNVPGDQMSDGIKQKEARRAAAHPPVSLAGGVLLVCTLIKDGTPVTHSISPHHQVCCSLRLLLLLLLGV